MSTPTLVFAGREGGEARGLALLQTYQPDHPVIRAILSGQDEAFWDAEAAGRQAAGMPQPSRKTARVSARPSSLEK